MKKPANKRKPAPAVPAKPADGQTIIIAAGGTGGHITPGISIAEAWLAAGGRVILATLAKNVQYPDIIALARNEAVSIVAYDAPRLPKNPLKIPAFFKRFRSAYRLIRSVGNEHQASAVIGMGGYSSFPPVLYSVLNRKRLYLCEQNAVWGLVTRFMRFFASAIFLSFAPDKRVAPKYVTTGNPLRSMFGPSPKHKPRAKAKGHIFFVGGSQGATDINALYAAFLTTSTARNFVCTVAAGDNGYAELTKVARKSDTILPFVKDMPGCLSDADFVVARCGSGTLFELLWAARPAFLIPYPFAADNHQRANADAIVNRLPAVVYDLRPFNANQACQDFLRFLENPPPEPLRQQDAAAQQQITRYIVKDLSQKG